MFEGSLQNVWFSNKIRLRQLIPWIFYNHWTYLVSNGRKSQWILSQFYPSQNERMLLWWLLIGSPSMHTFVHSLNLLAQVNIFETFMNIVEKLHGNSNIIIGDRDLIFIGKFWTELFSCLSTQFSHSSSYHP